MSQLEPPPTIFEIARDVPDGVEVYADPNGVKITVAPPTGRGQRRYFKAGFAFRMAFTLCWGVGMFYMGWANPNPLAKVFLIVAPVAVIGFATVWLAMLQSELRTPTVFSVQDVKSFRVAAPGRFGEIAWPLCDADQLELESNDIILHGPKGGIHLLRAYPPATREWVVCEFKRAGQWAYDWMTYRVTIAAAAERAKKPPQEVIPLPQPVANQEPEPPARITSLGVGPRILDYPIPPPRGKLRYETIPNGAAIIAPPEGLWSCGIVFRVIIALLYAAFVWWFRNPWLRIGFVVIGAAVAIRWIRKLNWQRKQKAVLAVLPGEFVLEDLGNKRERRTMPYEKVRALTAYLYRPDYNYVGIHTIEGDLWFGHRCNEDEIRWLGQFILARVGIPEEQMKINRGEMPLRTFEEKQKGSQPI